MRKRVPPPPSPFPSPFSLLHEKKKRKKTIIADKLRVPAHSVERYKKIDLEVALEEHLRANGSKLAGDARVAPFFYTVDPLSPVKQDPATGSGRSTGQQQQQQQAAVGEREKKPRARRQTIKAREELEGGGG